MQSPLQPSTSGVVTPTAGLTSVPTGQDTAPRHPVASREGPYTAVTQRLPRRSILPSREPLGTRTPRSRRPTDPTRPPIPTPAAKDGTTASITRPSSAVACTRATRQRGAYTDGLIGAEVPLLLKLQPRTDGP